MWYGAYGHLSPANTMKLHQIACASPKGLALGISRLVMICSKIMTLSKRQDFSTWTYLFRSSMAAAAANAVLDVLVEQNRLSDVTPKGEYLQNALSLKLGQHPHVGDIRGRGLFRALELVENWQDKTPFDPDKGWPKGWNKSRRKMVYCVIPCLEQYMEKMAIYYTCSTVYHFRNRNGSFD